MLVRIGIIRDGAFLTEIDFFSEPFAYFVMGSEGTITPPTVSADSIVGI